MSAVVGFLKPAARERAGNLPSQINERVSRSARERERPHFDNASNTSITENAKKRYSAFLHILRFDFYKQLRRTVVPS